MPTADLAYVRALGQQEEARQIPQLAEAAKERYTPHWLAIVHLGLGETIKR
jgi:hypothetical protein